MIEALPGREFRHPRRRPRPDLSAPRERTGAVLLRPARQPFAQVWIHNGMLTFLGGKMSKSLGNILTVRETLQAAPGEAIRFMLLKAQYRTTLDLTPDAPQEARRKLDRFYRALERDSRPKPARCPNPCSTRCATISTRPRLSPPWMPWPTRRWAATPPRVQVCAPPATCLGSLQHEPQKWFHAGHEGEAIEAAIAERLSARKAREFRSRRRDPRRIGGKRCAVGGWTGRNYLAAAVTRR